MAPQVAVCVKNTFIDFEILSPPVHDLRRSRSEADTGKAPSPYVSTVSSPIEIAAEGVPSPPSPESVASLADFAEDLTGICVKNTFICVPEAPSASALRRAQSDRCACPRLDEDSNPLHPEPSDETGDEQEWPASPCFDSARAVEESFNLDMSSSAQAEAFVGTGGAGWVDGSMSFVAGVDYIPAIVYVPVVVPFTILPAEDHVGDLGWLQPMVPGSTPPPSPLFEDADTLAKASPGALGVERVSASGELVQCFRWTADARKLKSSMKKAGSPGFKVACFGGEPMELKIFARPASISDAKGGSSFKTAKGRGSLELHCLQLPGAAGSSLVQFRFAVGSQPARGPVIHDFSEQTSCGLPDDDKWWDLSSEVDSTSDTFVVHLEVAVGAGAALIDFDSSRSLPC
mmetsp:Transcript_52308/g.150704  ORF Transcript_52308/g.150704 Transcript_52308/m.150704 type:complete len:402 (+) Transcript_52308:77-1282(+)